MAGQPGTLSESRQASLQRSPQYLELVAGILCERNEAERRAAAVARASGTPQYQELAAGILCEGSASDEPNCNAGAVRQTGRGMLDRT